MESCMTVIEPQSKKFKMDELQKDTVNLELESNINSETIFDFPSDMNIPSMLDDIEFKDNFPSVTDRYFTPYYRLNVTKPGDDICIWIHSNRICMISLAPSHNIFKGKKIMRVNFKVSDKLDRMKNKVSGKGKHGAQPLQENSNLCTITTSDEEIHTIKCGMIGKLVEVNETLLENPELLYEPPHRSGYLAIILLNIKLMDRMKKSLLTKMEYESALKQ